MKKTLLILLLFIYNISNAQIVNIPDANFKNALLNASSSTVINSIAINFWGQAMVIDTNNDNEIQESEASNVYILNVGNKDISSLIGIEYFTNLTGLYCDNNSLAILDISNNNNLIELYCYNNSLSALDVSNNNLIKELYCYNNSLSALNVSNNVNLKYLNCYNNSLSTLDVSNNTNLIELYCYINLLNTLDVSNNTNLVTLACRSNLLNTLDVSNNINLTKLYCSSNALITLDVSNNMNLTSLYCDNNSLSSLDISNNANLIALNCNNNDLEYINLKNGNNVNFDILDNYYSSHFQNLPNLQTACVDELNTDLTTFIVSETGHSVTFTEYCSFEPNLSNTINGTVNIDLDNNGCDTNDISLDNVLITADNGTESFGTFVLEDATYSMFTNEGDFTTTVTTNLQDYWSTTPTEYANNFTGFDNTFTANFCITPNQTINDVNITLIPTSQARPGFDVSYRIIYKNVGTTQLNGTVTLDFDDTKLNFLNASETINTQTVNSLTFNYTTLNPFETRTINLDFNVNPPTAAQPVNIGDILNFTATINPISGDYTEDDNMFTLNQTVIGSFDPNDITCLEGDEILLENVDKYLHYVIRFQNSGTASAINIVVKNILDAKLDWSTIQLETTSHDSRVVIKNGNEIEFIFENINLPDENTDEPGSHGFIAYKIKLKNVVVVVGNVIPNKADIFFDYNAAIETNIATTTIVNTLAVHENTLLNFSVYPIPAKDILHINSKTAISSIKIYSKLGQLVLKNSEQNTIDTSNLNQGLYFVKVKGVNGTFGVKKVIVE